MREVGRVYSRTMPTNAQRSVLRLGAPLLGSNLAMYIYRLADSAMVGRLGVEPLAAIAIATLYTNVHEMFIWPVALGVQAIASRRFGRDGQLGTSIGEVASSGLLAGAIAGGAALLLALAAPVLLPVLAPELAPIAVPYVLINALAFPIVGLAAALRGALSAIHRTSIVMVGIVVSNVLNVLLNAIFIFGFRGIPALGVTGAAIGTAVARVIYLAILGAVAIKTFDWPRPVPVLVGRIIRIGAPVAIQNAIAMTVVLLYQAMLGTLGAVYQAVTHVIFATYRINKTLVGGFANGAAILVGNALGRDDTPGAIEIVRAQQRIAALIGGTILIVVISIPATVAGVFSLSGPALALAIAGFRFFSVFYLVEIVAYSLEIIFTHNGWGRFVLGSEAITNLIGIVVLPAVAIFLLDLGYRGAWAGFTVYQIGHAIILFAGYRSRRWTRVAVERSA